MSCFSSQKKIYCDSGIQTRYAWIDESNEWSAYISSEHSTGIDGWPCTRDIVPGLFFCNFCKEHRPHSRKLLKDALDNAQSMDKSGYGGSKAVVSEFLDKANDMFWESFDPELCPLPKCPFNHSANVDSFFKKQESEGKSARARYFMNVDNGYDFSSYKSAECSDIVHQAPTTGSPIDCPTGSSVLGDTFRVDTEDGLNRLSWSVMQAMVSPIRSYSSKKAPCRRMFWAEPSGLHMLLSTPRLSVMSLFTYEVRTGNSRVNFLVDSLDRELDSFIRNHAPCDRLLAGSWVFTSDMTQGSSVHGLELGRTYGGSSNSMIHNIADYWSYYGSDVAFAEVVNLYGLRRWGSSSYVLNSTYVKLCALLPLSTQTSPGLRHSLYQIKSGHQSSKLEERIGDTFELICTLALLYNQTKLFSLVIQALVKISVVEFYDQYGDPCFVDDPFVDAAFGGKRDVARSSGCILRPAVASTAFSYRSSSDQRGIDEYLQGLADQCMPYGWQRASALGKRAKSAYIDLSWDAFGHPDVYVSSDLKVFSHARCWIRYVDGSRPSLMEGRSSHGLRQAHGAIRMKRSMARFLASSQMRTLVRHYFPGHHLPLQMRESVSRFEKTLIEKGRRRGDE